MSPQHVESWIVGWLYLLLDRDIECGDVIQIHYLIVVFHADLANAGKGGVIKRRIIIVIKSRHKLVKLVLIGNGLYQGRSIPQSGGLPDEIGLSLRVNADTAVRDNTSTYREHIERL